MSCMIENYEFHLVQDSIYRIWFRFKCHEHVSFLGPLVQQQRVTCRYVLWCVQSKRVSMDWPMCVCGPLHNSCVSCWSTSGIQWCIEFPLSSCCYVNAMWSFWGSMRMCSLAGLISLWLCFNGELHHHPRRIQLESPWIPLQVAALSGFPLIHTQDLWTIVINRHQYCTHEITIINNQ